MTHNGPLMSWDTGSTGGASPAAFELWPDHLRQRYDHHGQSFTYTLRFEHFLLRSRPVTRPELEHEICRALTAHIEEALIPPAARHYLRFWRRFDPVRLEQIEVVTAPRSTVRLDSQGVSAGDTTMRLDRFFFVGPAILQPFSLELRHRLRLSLARAADLDPEEGFPLLDHARLHAVFPLGDGLSFRLAGHRVVMDNPPTFDPFTNEEDTSPSCWGTEEFFLELDRLLPAELRDRRAEILEIFEGARVAAPAS